MYSQYISVSANTRWNNIWWASTPDQLAYISNAMISVMGSSYITTSWPDINGTEHLLSSTDIQNLYTAAVQRIVATDTARASDRTSIYSGGAASAIASLPIPQTLTMSFFFGDIWVGQTPGPIISPSNGNSVICPDMATMNITYSKGFADSAYNINCVLSGYGYNTVSYSISNQTSSGCTITFT